MRVSLDSKTKDRSWNQTDEVEEGNGDCLRECIMNDSGVFKSQMEFFYFLFEDVYSMMMIFSFAETWQYSSSITLVQH